VSQVSSCWHYAHDRFKDEIFTENSQEWNEVATRRDDPRVTRFKAMSWEEQEMSLEQTSQETLRSREGATTSESGKEIGDPQEDIEATRFYHESPVRTRDSPEIQVTQGMGEQRKDPHKRKLTVQCSMRK